MRWNYFIRIASFMFLKWGSPVRIFALSFLAVANTYASAIPKSFTVFRTSKCDGPASNESSSSRFVNYLRIIQQNIISYFHVHSFAGDSTNHFGNCQCARKYFLIVLDGYAYSASCLDAIEIFNPSPSINNVFTQAALSTRLQL